MPAIIVGETARNRVEQRDILELLYVLLITVLQAR